VEELWDRRLRHHYGTRFDVRRNLIDWDYQTHVRPVSGLVHSVLFRDWRMKGLAFEFGDETYIQPNRTLGSYIEVSVCWSSWWRGT
jgi:dynein assembly factor 3, axonemal